jgi:hypothetical protein
MSVSSASSLLHETSFRSSSELELFVTLSSSLELLRSLGLVGAADGTVETLGAVETLGSEVGAQVQVQTSVPPLGARLGSTLPVGETESDGPSEGCADGETESEGPVEGCFEGDMESEGSFEGSSDGEREGLELGRSETEGASVGWELTLGCDEVVGAPVGTALTVGDSVVIPHSWGGGAGQLAISTGAGLHVSGVTDATGTSVQVATFGSGGVAGMEQDATGGVGARVALPQVPPNASLISRNALPSHPMVSK